MQLAGLRGGPSVPPTVSHPTWALAPLQVDLARGHLVCRVVESYLEQLEIPFERISRTRCIDRIRQSSLLTDARLGRGLGFVKRGDITEILRDGPCRWRPEALACRRWNFSSR